MNDQLYNMCDRFLKRYPLTIAFRLSKHMRIIKKHLNPDEEVIYLFPAQRNYIFTEIFSTCIIAFTNKRIIIAQKKVLPGYIFLSITPDLFNDFRIIKGIIWCKIEIDTVKEVVHLSNIDQRAVIEIETNLSEYLSDIKPKFIKNESNK